MKRNYFIIIIACILLLTAGLSIVGLIYNKSDNEKLLGLSEHYDVSTDHLIAYVRYVKGSPELWLYHPDTSFEKKIVALENDKVIINPSFSNDSASLVFIASNKNLEDSLESTVYMVDVQTANIEELFSTDSLVTEIEFSIQDDSLFYLHAGTFQNYSPIASKRPHGLDIFEYSFADQEHNQLTDLEKYSITSLSIGVDGNSLFIQMDDDQHVETPEDIFNTNQRIFQIDLEDPTELEVVSDPNRTVDIYDFALYQDGEEMIFQSISNSGDGGTYLYELFTLNIMTKEEQQLTYLKQHTSKPVINENVNKVYFMVDKRFGKRMAEYHLYRMNYDGSEVEQISLPVE